jgi:hypothetical protein
VVVGVVAGVVVGEANGAAVGSFVGAVVGVAVGDAVGDAVGSFVGIVVGEAVGDAVDVAVGEAIGAAVGAAVGAAIGDAVCPQPGHAVRAACPVEASLSEAQKPWLGGLSSDEARAVRVKELVGRRHSPTVFDSSVERHAIGLIYPRVRHTAVLGEPPRRPQC